MAANTKQKTVVVGAGPVGALAAIYAAQRGHDVEVYELRSDLREPTTTPLNFTSSINLALSERGMYSLRKAECPGLMEGVLDGTIPMYARMIHGRDAKSKLYEQSQPYDIHGRAIQAVDRAGLNKRLLDELENMPHVKFFFNHKLTGADFNKNLAWFEKKKDAGQESRAAEIEISFDFMIGADGAHSAVRYHLMKFARVNYQQEYIDTLWCEFQIPPDENTGAFRLSPNHLHIWPGGDFMFIAIPSMDHSFTSTLFLPAAHFTALSTNPASLVAFFQEYFPGVVPDLISPISLQRQFAANPHLPLISIKCTPHHYRAAAVIVGDAAHAMVPFYGQGMNAGLEDVRVLFECLDRAAPSSSADDGAAVQAREAALAAYTTQRTPDAHAINDLALHNYAEMRAGVRSPLYRARKWVEERVDVWLPALGWHTRYARVSFGNQRYSDVERDVEVQSLMLVGAMSVLGGGVVAALAGLLLRLRR